MKKKLIISIILVVVLCASVFSLAACKKGVPEEALDSMLAQLKYQLRNNEQIARVPGTITYLDENDKEYKCNIDWQIVGTNEVTIGETNAEGERAISVPSTRTEDINFTLKATLTNEKGGAYKNKDGNAYVAEFTQSYAKTGYAAIALKSFLDKTISNPVAGTNYKLGFYLGSMYQVYYAKGGMDGKYMATSTNLSEAANATIETAADGFYLKVADKYVTLTGSLSKNANGNIIPKATISLTDTPSTVFNVAEKNILVSSVVCSGEGITDQIEKFVLGTYGTQYTTISTSSYFYISGETNSAALDTSQWVCRLCADTEIEMPAFDRPNDAAAIIAAVKDLPYNDYLPGGTYSLTGVVKEHTDTNYMTGSNPNITLIMTVGSEDVTCYRMNCSSAETVAVGKEITVTGYLINYKKDSTSAAVVEFAAGCNFVVSAGSIESSVDKVDLADLAVSKPYVIAITNTSNAKEYYLGTALYMSYYREPITDILRAPQYYLEQVDGGYKIYVLGDDGTTHKYLGAKVSGNNINLVVDDSDAATILVWKINENGIYVTSDQKDFYISQKGNNDRIGLYTLADNVYTGFLATIKEGKDVAEVELDEDYVNAEVVFENDKTSGKLGETITFTVAGKNGYTVSKVSVNGQEITLTDGKYTFTIEGHSVITIILLDPEGKGPAGTENNPYTVAGAISGTPDTGYSEDKVYVEGYITSATYSAQYQNWEVRIADTVGGETTLLCYRAVLAEGIETLLVGDKILVSGYLQKYNGNPQLTYKGSENTTVINRTVGDATITIGAHENTTIKFTGNETATSISDKNGTEVTFTVEVAQGFHSLSVKVNDVVIEAENGVYTVTLAGAMTITATVVADGEEAAKGTRDNPYTVEEAIAIAKGLAGAASNKTVFNDAPVYIMGIVVSITSQNNFDVASAKNGTNTLQFYNGTNDTDTATIYINDKVLLYGYIANYSAGYKSELAANNGVIPSVKEITTEDATITQTASEDYTITFSSSTGKNGTTVTFTINVNVDGKEVKNVTVTNGKVTFNETDNNYEVVLNGDMIVTVELKDLGSNVETITLKLGNSSSTGIGSIANTTLATTTIKADEKDVSVECSYLNCKQNSGYLMLCKPASGVAAGYITGSVNGTIKKITITTGSAASAVAQYIVLIGTEAFSGSQTGEAVNVVAGATQSFENSVSNAGYFYIAVTKSTANKDVNGQITQIVIDYEPIA